MSIKKLLTVAASSLVPEGVTGDPIKWIPGYPYSHPHEGGLDQDYSSKCSTKASQLLTLHVTKVWVDFSLGFRELFCLFVP